jgi:hypothetical protein
MERDDGWWSRVVRDGVHGGEDGSSESTVQQHMIGEYFSGRYF